MKKLVQPCQGWPNKEARRNAPCITKFVGSYLPHSKRCPLAYRVLPCKGPSAYAVRLRLACCWKRFQKFREIRFFRIGQPQFHATLVVAHNVVQSGKTPIVVKAACLVTPQSSQRRCPIHVRW